MPYNRYASLGAVVDLNAGDALVIPAGVAHKGEVASPDLLPGSVARIC